MEIRRGPPQAKLCRYWAEGYCRSGSRCPFAHPVEQRGPSVQPPPPPPGLPPPPPKPGAGSASSGTCSSTSRLGEVGGSGGRAASGATTNTPPQARPLSVQTPAQSPDVPRPLGPPLPGAFHTPALLCGPAPRGAGGLPAPSNLAHYGRPRAEPPLLGRVPPTHPFYKTQMCTHYLLNKRCTHSTECSFAHGSAELRELPEEFRRAPVPAPYPPAIPPPRVDQLHQQAEQQRVEAAQAAMAHKASPAQAAAREVAAQEAVGAVPPHVHLPRAASPPIELSALVDGLAQQAQQQQRAAPLPPTLGPLPGVAVRVPLASQDVRVQQEALQQPQPQQHQGLPAPGQQRPLLPGPQPAGASWPVGTGARVVSGQGDPLAPPLPLRGDTAASGSGALAGLPSSSSFPSAAASSSSHFPHPREDEDDVTRYKKAAQAAAAAAAAQGCGGAAGGSNGSGAAATASSSSQHHLSLWDDSLRNRFPAFVCPISMELFEDPVVAADGHSYERASIEDWLYNQKKNTSPYTNNELAHKVLVPNATLKKAMDEVKEFMESLSKLMGTV